MTKKTIYSLKLLLILVSLVALCILTGIPIAISNISKSQINFSGKVPKSADITDNKTSNSKVNSNDESINNNSDDKNINISIQDSKTISIHKNGEADAKQAAANKEASSINPIDITLSFAGDCTIGTDPSFPYRGSFAYEVDKNEYDYFFKNVRHIFEDDDLTLVNLETTLTNANKMADKTFRFKGKPEWVNILTEGSVEMVNISNNHIYDFLNRGFKDTINTLDNAGIHYSGEGHKAFYSVKGINICSLGYRGWDSAVKKQIKEDIEQVKTQADIIIISFHWGQERHYIPNAVQKELGRWCIDNGATIVVGHHPHVIQGIEKYKDRYIVYSLGNFCFGGNRNPSDKDSFIFQNIIRINPVSKAIEGCESNIIPCSISSTKGRNNYQPTPLTGKEKLCLMDRIQLYSQKIK